ncbi:uncharacterized protein VDAG_07534 [Verticillium dahliae VdLs.17]|uniref:Uncharacterized protein n=1 Tax=Verticillium dahliae (strain VdLs.17 / ATCC MYA-4575 / FGSC 10137) TaxID=498257 RepID=G2XBK2_VERDV|nr:uncharacterized protein VDAG_07534 [Verticillium dahliae VdLs.17]EGY16370.1 hypothetical protein VDAG_07534 [Verticillium dahliae VdLs.17]KAH6699339.1 hypothetical protein EV126DRAFT_423579 [Verticillium dahliae]
MNSLWNRRSIIIRWQLYQLVAGFQAAGDLCRCLPFRRPSATLPILMKGTCARTHVLLLNTLPKRDARSTMPGLPKGKVCAVPHCRAHIDRRRSTPSQNAIDIGQDNW